MSITSSAPAAHSASDDQPHAKERAWVRIESQVVTHRPNYVQRDRPRIGSGQLFVDYTCDFFMSFMPSITSSNGRRHVLIAPSSPAK